MTPGARSRRALGSSARLVRGYVGAVAALAVLASVAALLLAGPPPRWDWFVALAAIGVLVSTGPPQVIGRVQIFTSGIVYLAAIPLTGPVGAAVIAAMPVLLARNEPIKRIYNTAMRALFTLAGACAYQLAGGVTLHGGPMSPADLYALAGRLVLAAVALTVVNVALLAGIIRVSSGIPLRSTLISLSQTAVPGYVGYTIAAFLLVVLWSPVGLGWFAAVLGLPFAVLAQWGLRQYVAGWETRQRILSGLLAALDVRDPGARAQAEQVARVVEPLSAVVGMSPRETEHLMHAARLRDVGLLAVPAAALAPGQAVGADAAAAVREHPATARQVLGDISFLAQALATIEAHHERMDGRGYPRGAVGDEIPLGARVLAVADAYVSLVAPRADRPALTPQDAIAECARRTDHLDLSVVHALQGLVDRRLVDVDAPDEPPTGASRAVLGAVADHTHPATKLQGLP